MYSIAIEKYAPTGKIRTTNQRYRITTWKTKTQTIHDNYEKSANLQEQSDSENSFITARKKERYDHKTDWKRNIQKCKKKLPNQIFWLVWILYLKSCVINLKLVRFMGVLWWTKAILVYLWFSLCTLVFPRKEVNFCNRKNIAEKLRKETIPHIKRNDIKNRQRQNRQHKINNTATNSTDQITQHSKYLFLVYLLNFCPFLLRIGSPIPFLYIERHSSKGYSYVIRLEFFRSVPLWFSSFGSFFHSAHNEWTEEILYV